MDKIEKTLAKLSDKERKKVKQALTKLFADKIKELDIKKLKDHDDIFQLRVGLYFANYLSDHPKKDIYFKNLPPRLGDLQVLILS